MRGLFSAFLLLASTACALEPLVIVQDALIAKDVLAKQPVEIADTFPSDVGKLIFWTKIRTSSIGPVTLHHVWYYQGKEVSRMTFKTKAKVYRTWSRKSIWPNMIGDWKAAVLDENGAVLKETSFKITTSTKAVTQ